MHTASWESLVEYFSDGIPFQVPVYQGSNASFLYSGTGGRFGLRLPAGDAQTIASSPFQELETAFCQVDGQPVLELTTTDDALYYTFYLFSLGILEQFESGHLTAREAIERSLDNWNRLLTQRSLMSDSVRLGLSGELVLLHALLGSNGPDAFLSWVGPVPEPHDFRFGKIEIEVKSTTKPQRIHRVSSLEQLEASAGMELWILSLQFEPAGMGTTGKTLPERIHEIRALLGKDSAYLNPFNAYLLKLGYRDFDATYYKDRSKLRTMPCLVPVAGSFQRLTRSILNTGIPGKASDRITHVEYDLLLDGLGIPWSHPGFQQVFGKKKQLEFADE